MRSVNPHGNLLRWVNTSAEEIPPYGVVRLSDVNRDTVLDEPRWNAVKPDGETGVYGVSGGNKIPVSSEGSFTTTIEKKIARVLSADTFAFGDEIGPVDGEWGLGADGSGWTYLEELSPNYALVVQKPGGGGGGSARIEFTIDSVVCPGEEGNDGDEIFVWVQWEKYTGGCGVVPTGVDEYTGLIKVFDRCVFSFFVKEELVDATGTATYFYSRETYPGEGCDSRWIVDDVCAGPECDTI